eukprot:TRINITY_DN4911_c0_g1_i6.p1 TRINITY_DN4911_c0_g1~~TRINITY_DN4911_c0_g1_i6.p1  ORF type:complete len:142 (+),score=34.45 TRINITY_DN4911_c0_g1_i6:652-1077(+)
MLVFDAQEMWSQADKNLGIWRRRYIDADAQDACVLVVANKSHEQAATNYPEVQAWVNKWNQERGSGLPEVQLVLTSAKSGSGVAEAFHRLASIVLKRRLALIDDEPEEVVTEEIDTKHDVEVVVDSKADKDKGCGCECVIC